MSALAVVVPNYRDSSHWDIVRDAIAPLLGAIVPLAMNMAREFGISGLTAMISVLIKDPVLLPGILEFAPDLVSAAFDFLPFASDSKHENACPEHVISIVLNLVRELRDQPEVQNDIGQHIWHCAIQTFDEIRGTPGIEGCVEIFNSLTLNLSSLPDQIWQLVDVLTEMVPVDPCPLLCLPCSYFFHNLIMRDRDQAREYLSNFAAAAEMILDLVGRPSRFESIAIHFAALLTIAPPNSIPAELLEGLCHVLQGIDVFTEITDDTSPCT
jgi:hypothetical protein